MTFVILVDEKDRPVGVMEKLQAHKRGGSLHRAFSVFIFNDEGELLLQRRSRTKYHSGGLWTNTVCSHPRPGELTHEAAERRIPEEMGFKTNVEHIGEFIYRADVGNGLTEFEYDHVFAGIFNGNPYPNPEEAEDWKWMDFVDVISDVKKHPEKYTAWFRIILLEKDDIVDSLMKYY